MARIIVFQHSTDVTAGRLGLTLRDHGFRLDFVRLDLAPETAPPGVMIGVPADLDGVAGVISLGGVQNPDEEHARIEPEKAYLRAAHEAGLPVVGLCLGCELLAEALGGTVEKMDEPEVGLVDASVGFAGQSEPVLFGAAWEHTQFMSHGFRIAEPPPGASVLMTTDRSPVAAMRIGMRTYGFQFHPECDRATIEYFAGREDSMFAEVGLVGDALKAQLDERYDRFARVSDRLCVNLATLVFQAAAAV